MLLVIAFFLALLSIAHCNQIIVSDDGTVLSIKDFRGLDRFRTDVDNINLAKVTEIKLFNSTPGIFFRTGAPSNLLIPELESWTKSSALEKVSFINPPTQHSPNSNYFEFMTMINFTKLQVIVFNESSYSPDMFFHWAIKGYRVSKKLADIESIQLDFITQPSVTWRLRHSIENTLKGLHCLTPALKTLEVVDVPDCLDRYSVTGLLKGLIPMNLNSLTVDINLFSEFNTEFDWGDVFNSFLTLKNLYLQFNHTLFLQYVTNDEFETYCDTPFKIGQYVDVRNLDLDRGYVAVLNGESDFIRPLRAFRQYIRTQNPNFQYTLLNGAVELNLNEILPPETSTIDPSSSDDEYEDLLELLRSSSNE